MPPKKDIESKPDQEKKVEAKPATRVDLVKWIKYPPSGRQEEILQKLIEQRKTGEFCDIQLKLSATKTVYAHKAVLAAQSAYFEGMFTSTFLEATSGVVDMSHITNREDVLDNVINIFYGKTFIIDETNVSDTINLATMLMLGDLREECAKILNVVVNIRNAIGLVQISLSYELNDVKEKVLPVVNARFHDYILLQEEVRELSVEGFELVHSVINTSFISRKSRYIEFIMRWFSAQVSTERARLLLSAIKGIKFKITKRAYKDFEKVLKELVSHLDDANIDVNEETSEQLKKALLNLEPADYVKNIQIQDKEAGDEKKTTNDSDSELEDEPERPAFMTGGRKMKVLGPPTKKKGYTAEEEKIWEKAHEDMKERDQHRIWAAEWPLDITGSLGTLNDPRRPKRIRRERSPDVLKSRKRRIKSELELKEEANLVEIVLLIAPSKDFLDDSKDDTLDISAYIPRKRAWYKIASLSASSIQKKFNKDSSSSQRNPEETRRPRPRGSADSDDDDDDERLAMMLDMYGPELPPDIMMMMHNMPSSRRHRIMEEIMRGRVSPHMLRRMFRAEMDDDDDRQRYEHMMMREMSRRHRHHPMMAFGGMGPMGFLSDMEPRRRELSVSPLTDKKWKVVCLKYRLYFYHQDVSSHVFCYDLATSEWFKSEVKYEHVKDKYRGDYAHSVDAIELILMGQILHAVLRIAMVPTRRESMWSSSKEDLIKESKQQNVYTKHVVYRMTGELDKTAWEMVMESEGHDMYIPIDEKLRVDPLKDKYSSYPFYGTGFGPMVRQPGGLKTFLYAADEEQLIIITAVRKPDYRDESIIGYNICSLDILYLDLLEHEHLFDTPHYSMFLRNIMPLFSDDLAVFVDDEFKEHVVLDLGKPGQQHRLFTRGSQDVEGNREFITAEEQYPKCSSLMVSSLDGKNLWVFRGKDDDVSETLEYYTINCYPARESSIKNVKHPPPPFKCFSLAAVTKVDSTRIKTFALPTKYLHAD